MSKLLDNLWSIFYKYCNYSYDDSMNMQNYRIKSLDKFNESKCGICLDFIGQISFDLRNKEIKHNCYFTEVHKNGITVATHTYIIVSDWPFNYWLECAWQSHKSLFFISSYRDIERQLKEEYDADEVHTVVYDPFKCYNMNSTEFFLYLNKEGIELP